MGKVGVSLQRGIWVKILNTPRHDQDKGSGSPFLKSTCSKRGKSQYGKCLGGMDGFYGGGKNWLKNERLFSS